MDTDIMVDLDGVILDFNRVFRDYLQDLGLPIPEGYIPQTYCWEEDPVMADYDVDREKLFSGFDPYWIFIEPFPGAVEFLWELRSLGFNIHFCTARNTPPAKEAALQGILEHQLPMDSLCFRVEKGPWAEALKIRIALEDSPEKAQELREHGCRVLVRRWPYNRELWKSYLTFGDYSEAIQILSGMI